MLKVGHRGAAGYCPESTLASFAKAIEMGVDAVECDVHLCRSGELVVIHDTYLERSTNGSGDVATKTLAQIKALDAGQGERVPTLGELLDFIDRRVTVFIELKSTDSAQAVAALVTEYAGRGWEYAQLVVISFFHPVVLAVKQANPRIHTGVSFVGVPVDFAASAERAMAEWVNPGLHYATQELIDDAHARGRKVMLWTANTPRDIAHAKALGPDALVSDFPDHL